MGADEKANNAAKDVGGKIKEGVGKATGNDSKVAEGKADQSSAKIKKAGENIKDAIKN
ncbi:CsbD family protein [Lacisediminihabitans sp. H27-G8]|uniref:CsbD family protein n=1 Tax=Lacisediminihabitans sp. H27-G8 TaxID=3111909 RepID=UPI0038FCC95C